MFKILERLYRDKQVMALIDAYRDGKIEVYADNVPYIRSGRVLRYSDLCGYETYGLVTTTEPQVKMELYASGFMQSMSENCREWEPMGSKFSPLFEEIFLTRRKARIDALKVREQNAAREMEERVAKVVKSVK